MKKIFTVLSCLISIVILLSTCGENPKPSQKENISSIAIDGSTSMEKVVAYLSEDYQVKNPNLKITYNPTGSSAGIQAVSEGKCDIGVSSRDLKAKEAENLNAIVVAIDGIAIIVNKENDIANLKMEDLSKVFLGEITNWKELGGKDAPIVLIGREAASGTRDGFESITKTKEKCKYVEELSSTGDVIQTVAQNPNAIGYASLSAVKDTVKTLKINDIAPKTETILDKSYPIQRNFNFVLNKNKQVPENVQKFIDYALSNEASNLINKAGAIAPRK